MTDPKLPEGAEPEPLDDDEILVQRYCDCVLSDAEAEAVEARMEADPAFARRVDRSAALFSLLELHGEEARVADLAEKAVEAWARPAGWVEFFGGLAPAVAGFLLLDALLGGLLVGLMAVRGPTTILKSWLVGLKDILVLADGVAPSADQLLPVLSVSMVTGVGLLAVVMLALRGVLGRVGARSGAKR